MTAGSDPWVGGATSFERAVVGGTVNAGSPGPGPLTVVEPPGGVVGLPGLLGGFVGRGVGFVGLLGGFVGRGVGVGGARANGGSSPTIALGWMLRSWFLLPDPSSWSVRMCHGAPDTMAAPSEAPPFDRSQYADCARWPPHESNTAARVFLKVTRKSAELLPSGEPEWTGPLIEVIVPPYIVNRRGDAE